MTPDILSPEFSEDPFPVLELLRDEHPVYFHEAMNSYMISRYEDVEVSGGTIPAGATVTCLLAGAHATHLPPGGVTARPASPNTLTLSRSQRDQVAPNPERNSNEH